MRTSTQSTSLRVYHKPSDTLLADLHFTFEERLSEHGHHGRLQVLINYDDPNEVPPHPRAHCISQSWYRDAAGIFQMAVSDFQIPVCLRYLGLGTFIWKQFYLGLPGAVRSQMMVSGLLSAVDAYTPVVDEERRTVFETVDGQQVPVLKNQISGRNHFWARLLVPLEPGGQVLSCDADGNGKFNGYLKDLSDIDWVSYNRIAVSSITSKIVS